MRLVSLTFFAALTVALVGCDDEDTPPSARTTETPAVAATSTTGPSVNTPEAGASEPTPLPSYPCEADASCVCTDFPVRAEAQRVFDEAGGANWAGLDPDGNGKVCETTSP
jgi:predicted component of type VI protein secretion system